MARFKRYIKKRKQILILRLRLQQTYFIFMKVCLAYINIFWIFTLCLHSLVVLLLITINFSASTYIFASMWSFLSLLCNCMPLINNSSGLLYSASLKKDKIQPCHTARWIFKSANSESISDGLVLTHLRNQWTSRVLVCQCLFVFQLIWQIYLCWYLCVDV